MYILVPYPFITLYLDLGNVLKSVYCTQGSFWAQNLVNHSIFFIKNIWTIPETRFPKTFLFMEFSMIELNCIEIAILFLLYKNLDILVHIFFFAYKALIATAA